jgi:hypothetical protein
MSLKNISAGKQRDSAPFFLLNFLSPAHGVYQARFFHPSLGVISLDVKTVNWPASLPILDG